MTSFAAWAAAFVTPTSTPKEQKPCSSGGVTWMSATSSGRTPDEKRSGISPRRHGVKSARPSFTAARTFSLTKSVFTRRWPSSFGSV